MDLILLRLPKEANSASETFTVTALSGPIIFLDPDSGPVGSSVDILGAGFAPNSVVTYNI